MPRHGRRDSVSARAMASGHGVQAWPYVRRFPARFVDVGEVRLRVRYGGEGPAVLLVHGHPRTLTTWWGVATLGHSRFHAVGHDRGGYVVQRLALDHPGRVGRMVILGDVPIGEALARCDARFAAAWWHWFFIGQPAPLAERLIAADVHAWYKLEPAVVA